MALRSGIDPKSSDFTRNADAMRALVADLRNKLSQVAGGGGEAARAKHTARGSGSMMRSAKRSASAAMVKLGFGPVGPGMTEPSAMCRPGWP